MYDFLQGRVARLNPTRLTLETQGVGWELFCSVATSRRLSQGREARIWTHLVVREDLLALYGFHSEEERLLFRELIAVAGVGPRVGLAILSGLEGEDLPRAVLAGESARLTRVPGVGKKIAERLVLELKGRFERLFPLLAGDGDGLSGASGITAPGGGALAEALEALLALGYKPAQAEADLARAAKGLTGEPGVEELLRAVLQKGR
jgi:holliday junction DNA helicase RuvA